MTGDPAPVVRPAGLGHLGSNSWFAEPYTVRSPHRVHVGDDVLIGPRAFLSVVEEYNGVRYEPELTIGDGTMIGHDLLLHCAGGITIGSKVGISARVFIGDSFRDYDDPGMPYSDMPIDEPAPVRICDGAAVGVGAIVLPGVTIGERAVVAGGSVVTRDVPPRAIVFGNPARVVRSWSHTAGGWVTGG